MRTPPTPPILPDGTSRHANAGVLGKRALRRLARPVTAPMQAEQSRLEAQVAATRTELGALRADGELVARRVGKLTDRLAEVAGYGQAIDAVLDAVLLRDLAPDTRVRKSPSSGPGNRAICSLATGAQYRSMLSRAALSFERYAERWGWDLVLSTEEHLSEGRAAPWGKVPLIRSLLDDYEWVLWLDADVVVVDLEADICEAIEDGKDMYLVEHTWLGQYTANSGVVLLRSCDWSRAFLDAVWASEVNDHVWWENAAVLDLLGYALNPARLVTPTAWLKRTKFVDLRYNSIELDRAPTPAFVHRGFYSPARRTRQITADLQCALGRAHPMSAGWEIPARPIESVTDVRRREELPLLLNALGLTDSAVEVGVRKGHFSEWMLEHWHGGRLMAIDPWLAEPSGYADISNVTQVEHDANHAETRRRVARFSERVQVWRATGAEAAQSFPQACLDFAYLHARHDEASVGDDLQTWWPIIRSGGVLAGHVYLDGMIAEGDFGVRSAVDAFFGELGLPVHATSDDEPWPSWIVRKP